MKFVYYFLFMFLIFHISLACSVIKQCYHGGIFNNVTCTCECFSSYKGDYCEFANCNNQSPTCLIDFGQSFCNDASIANYCPQMCNQPICKCGFDSCLNGGFFFSGSCICICPTQYTGIRCDSLITTTTTTTTIQKCSMLLPCMNGAKMNQQTCRCECYPAYTGSLCETLICSNEPIECQNKNNYVVEDCMLVPDLVSFYCPVLCGKCQPTTKPTTTTACVPFKCVNGGKFNQNKCLCECNPSYTGTTCETILCNTLDPDLCNTLQTEDCMTLSVFYYCPRFCGLCLSSLTTTTPKNCLVYPCINGGQFNSQFCSCICYPSFAGQFCENLVCSAQPSECNSFSSDKCSDTAFSLYCPALCGRCQTSIITTTTQVPTTTKACNLHPCMNGGTYNSDTCKCQCINSAYTGILCETILCNMQPIECNNFQAARCIDVPLYNYCPVLCGRCTTTTLTTPTTTTTSCIPTTCLNGASFNTQLCRCSCFEAYTGSLCETLMCDMQPIQCSTFKQSQCSSSPVQYYCPVLCGSCQNQTTLATTTQSACKPITCLNGAEFVLELCKCSCFAAWTGALCETLMCDQEPPQCSSFKQTQCLNNPVQYYCPVLCGLCSNATTSTSPANTCIAKTCNYNFTFDLNECKCNCLPGYTGELCTFNCSTTQLDDSICSQLSCDVPVVPGLCPNKCLCPNKPICQPCSNGGILDVFTCACTCNAKYTGQRCQYAVDPCELDDDPAFCSGVDCFGNLPEETFLRCQKKCLCCGNKSCYNLGQLTKTCVCECPNNSFDKLTNCRTPTAECADQFPNCIQQFGLQGCNETFVFAICPKMCNFCKN